MVFIGGCTTVIKEYKSSATNVKTWQEKYKHKDVKIKVYSLNASNHKSILCRLDGVVTPLKGMSFEKYITGALINEMEFSNIYSEDANKTLNISYDKVSFNSLPGMASWIINATFSTENNSDFKIESEYKFSTNYFASLACKQVSASFPKAVEKFIYNTLTHPNFSLIIDSK